MLVMDLKIAPYPLTSIEIQECYQDKSRFRGDNLPKKIKDGEYVINLDEHADFATEEIRRFGNKNIETSIYKIQANNSTMSGNISIGFIDFMRAGKTLIILNCFRIIILKKMTL